MSEVIQPKKWTENELKEAGFKKYARRKVIIMARRLPASEAPLEIKTGQGDTIVAKAGYMICYDAGDTLYDHLTDYYHWPVEPNIFEATYREWDEDLKMTPTMKRLIELGCKAYYKTAGVWAKDLEQDVYIQSLEHEKPVLVQKDRFLAIGAEGEPYHMSEQSFHSRYDPRLTETPFKRVLNKLIGFFKSEG